MSEQDVSHSYETKEQAQRVADWLAKTCQQQCGGTWYAHVHENLGWRVTARLGFPFIATMHVRKLPKTGELVFHGGFVSRPDHLGWRDGESFSGKSPLEVLIRSYTSVIKKVSAQVARLSMIDDHALIATTLCMSEREKVYEQT